MIAAIYARKSTEQNGIADEAKSVTRQIEQAKLYADRKGWTVADEFLFVDDGISGAEFSTRPGYMRLLNVGTPRAPFQILIVSELSRLGREQLETGYAVKQLAQAGVRIFSYLEDREILLDTPTDKFLMAAANFAAEIEREKARQRVYDAMSRKARNGHVTGGKVFGYDNVPVMSANGQRSHVEFRVNTAEAAVVRRIFEMAADGFGLKAITKTLNEEGAPTPRPKCNRPQAWAPSSVREVLHREQYRGRRLWNKTRKRDAWGQSRQTDRPVAEWLEIECKSLRIVSDVVWRAVHDRFQARRMLYDCWRKGQGGAPDGRGVRSAYFLTGFSRCACCGGSMQAVSRASSTGRYTRYLCTTYWNRGASVCANRRPVAAPVADRAVHDPLKSEVLKPGIIERALDLALDALASDAGPNCRRETLASRLQTVEAELRNLSDTAARGGAVPMILDALQRREQERRRLIAELEASERRFGPVLVSGRDELLEQLRGLLDDWSGLLDGNVPEARRILDLVLAGQRIAFRPVSDSGYELTVPVAFDRVLTAAIPELSGLQDRLVAVRGFEPRFHG